MEDILDTLRNPRGQDGDAKTGQQVKVVQASKSTSYIASSDIQAPIQFLNLVIGPVLHALVSKKQIVTRTRLKRFTFHAILRRGSVTFFRDHRLQNRF